MTKYIALLRGVNVGGNNIVDMKRLKATFIAAGFPDTKTYINSGNIIFSGDMDEVTAQKTCADLISETFSLSIAVLVLSREELDDTLAHAPKWWGNAPDSRHNAIFVIPPATAEEICAEIGAIKPEYEKVAHHGKLIFWSAPMATFSRTRWSTVSKRAAYQKITIRNANTVFKLAELARR